MSKMSDIALTIKELRDSAAAVNEAADWLEQYCLGDDIAGQPNSEATAKEAPEAKATPTLEQVRAVLADKARAGYTANVRALLLKFGADKLSKIDPSNYAALLRDVEALDKNI